jgi:hypothetical protein
MYENGIGWEWAVDFFINLSVTLVMATLLV